MVLNIAIANIALTGLFSLVSLTLYTKLLIQARKLMLIVVLSSLFSLGIMCDFGRSVLDYYFAQMYITNGGNPDADTYFGGPILMSGELMLACFMCVNSMAYWILSFKYLYISL